MFTNGIGEQICRCRRWLWSLSCLILRGDRCRVPIAMTKRVGKPYVLLWLYSRARAPFSTPRLQRQANRMCAGTSNKVSRNPCRIIDLQPLAAVASNYPWPAHTGAGVESRRLSSIRSRPRCRCTANCHHSFATERAQKWPITPANRAIATPENARK